MTATGSDQDPTTAEGAQLRRALVRFGLLVALVAIAWAVFRWTPLARFLEREELVALLDSLARSRWAPWAFVGLWLLASPLGLPVSPLVFTGGAVFGVLWGWTYSVCGSLLGATLSFLLARLLGRELVVHVVGAERLRQVEGAIGRHGFWTVLRLRFLPLPFVVLNYGAALVGMSFLSFLASSLLGLVPSLLVYTYFSHALVRAAASERGGLLVDLVFAMALLLALTLLPTLVRRLASRRRGSPLPPP